GSAPGTAGAGLLLIGPDAEFDTAALRAYLEGGGKVLFLPRSQADGGLGVTLKPAAAGFAGSLSVPGWPEASGLSASDRRWRTDLETAPWVVSGGAEIGADGLIGRQVIGKGVAIFCQVAPDRFQADEKTYLRYTRWRATRAVAQLLANLGASFPADRRIFHPAERRAIGLDGEWQMKVTLRLAPSRGEPEAPTHPGVTAAAPQLPGLTLPP